MINRDEPELEVIRADLVLYLHGITPLVPWLYNAHARLWRMVWP